LVPVLYLHITCVLWSVYILYDVIRSYNRQILLNSLIILTTMASHFATVPAVNEDAAFGIIRLARADLDPKATSLNAGLYRDEKGNPWILPVVQEVRE
jgi:hypothetical protein